MARVVSLAASLIGSAALMLGLAWPKPPWLAAVAGRFILAGALGAPPMALRGEFIGNCCAKVPIGINKPKQDTVARTH